MAIHSAHDLRDDKASWDEAIQRANERRLNKKQPAPGVAAVIVRLFDEDPSCPHCQADGPHENNQARGRDLEYRCSGCGEAFGPATEV